MNKKNNKKKRNTFQYFLEEKNQFIEDNQSQPKRKRKRYKKVKKIRYYFLIFILIVGILLITILLKLHFSKKRNEINPINYISNHTKNLINNTEFIINKTNLLLIKNISDNLNQNNSKETREELKNIRETELKNGLIFLDKCEKGILNNSKIFIKSEKPKISVIIPVHDCEKTIKRAVRSIQYQNMLDIEIILVNDFSNDNVKIIIEEMEKEDQRIKIINNDKNMGALYSRCIGTLESKGKYILAFDSDDIFLNENVFNTIYEEAEKTKVDILSFKAFDFHSSKNIKDSYYTNINNNSIILQPELSNYNIISPNHIIIWCKLIKSEVYKKAVNNLGKERYSNYLNWDEDICMVFVLCQLAQSYKFIEKYGLIHFIPTGKVSSSEPPIKKMFSEIFFLEIIFDFSKIMYKNIAVKKLKDMKGYHLFNLSDEKNKAYFISVAKRILNSEYIDKKDKDDIIKIYEGDIDFKSILNL